MRQLIDLFKQGVKILEFAVDRGKADVGELHWTFLADDLNLRPGWNNIQLSLASARKTGGSIDLSAVNYFRLYHTRLNADATLKIDNIRFYEDY